jgi:hypothetical protein
VAKLTPAAKLVTGFAVCAVGAAVAYRALSKLPSGNKPEVTYPPLDTLKPMMKPLWIVDSGPITALGLKLPIRMTVVRLSSGDLFLHSPTRFTAELARELNALGPVRHLVAPTIAHWSYLQEWQQAYPDAVTWAVPGLRDRAQVRQSGVRIDEDLGPEAPPAWADDMVQGVVAGGRGFREVYFFEKRSRTLLLADLIENLEPAKLFPVTRLAMRAVRATRNTTALHVRAVLRLGGAEAASSIRAMNALSPDHVIFAHGRCLDENGAHRLRDAFAWLNLEHACTRSR